MDSCTTGITVWEYLYNMLLQGISHAIMSVAINSNFKILAPGPPQSEILATPLGSAPPSANSTFLDSNFSNQII